MATSNWTVDRSGNGFHVNATYLGSGSRSNTTGFDVVPRRVRTWISSPGGISGPMILDLASSPFGVCANTSVNAGAQLIVEAGVVVRFCRDTGLFVNGTLTVDATPTNRVYFLSYELQMQAGDWRGIAFLPGAPSNSLLANVAIQAVTEGVVVQGTSVAIRDSTIALATRSAVSLTSSGSSIRNSTIAQADIGVLIDGSTGVVLDGNRIQGTRIGVRATNSDITLSGLQANRTTVIVDGGSFRDNGVGVFFSEVPQAALGRVAVSGGNDSLRAVDSRGILVDLSGFSGAMYRSVFFINVTATFVNTTLRALQYDLVLVASSATLVNSTYAVLLPPVNSVLTIRNFLHVLVESNLATRLRVENAWVNVTSNGLRVSSRQTNPAGWSQWILLTDSTVRDAGRKDLVTNVVEVRLDGFTAVSAPRTVDMRDEKPDRAFQILGSEIARGVKALVIARLYPDEVRKRYGLKDVPVLWLSRGYGKETVNPTNLGALVQEIERFMSGKEDSVILLDGLEYLLVQNDPQKVVKFVQVLVDSASVHHSKLLVSFDVKSVNEAVRALITRDLQDL